MPLTATKKESLNPAGQNVIALIEGDNNMPEDNSQNTNTEAEKKSKEDRDPCTGEHCTIEMCRRCHDKSYECSASKVDNN